MRTTNNSIQLVGSKKWEKVFFVILELNTLFSPFALHFIVKFPHFEYNKQLKECDPLKQYSLAEITKNQKIMMLLLIYRIRSHSEVYIICLERERPLLIVFQSICFVPVHMIFITSLWIKILSYTTHNIGIIMKRCRYEHSTRWCTRREKDRNTLNETKLFIWNNKKS